MTAQHLVLTIRLHDARYHGVGEWPPAPARLFQALVAGVGRGQKLGEEPVVGLAWLERLPPPVIAAPRVRAGHPVGLFVPNNDADTVGGDPERLRDLRVRKQVSPRLFETADPLVYAWPIEGDPAPAAAVVAAADELYQLGRGVDMAWAVGEVLDDDAWSTRLASHGGTVHRPEATGGRHALLCPAPGSLASLVERHRAALARIRVEGERQDARTLFVQPPKPRFRAVDYGAEPRWSAYELRDAGDATKLWPWPVERIVALTERLRDGAAARLREALIDQDEAIDRSLIGRRPGEERALPVEQRVRILALPSIGHTHADRAVRRFAVEVPSGCPLRAGDVAWAFSGLEPAAPELDAARFVVVESDDRTMFESYCRTARRWRSVTPVALPVAVARRRIEPSRRADEAKAGAERVEEERRASRAVAVALRHAGVRAPLVAVTVQREPFASRGTRAEPFAADTRFAKERLWHVEVELGASIQGPLILGDGRFLGLGVMAPVSEPAALFGFALGGDRAAIVDPEQLVRAARRAVMSRAQQVLGDQPLRTFFSGHDSEGGPARTEQSGHLAVQWDPIAGRLLVIAPHLLDRRSPSSEEQRELRHLAKALDGFIDLRAGRAGRFSLTRCAESELGVYATHARQWSSVRPYAATRHGRGESAASALAAVVIVECERRGLPRPRVTVESLRGIAGRGLEGMVQLEFARAVEGPVVLGRTRYLGGGLFLPDRGLA